MDRGSRRERTLLVGAPLNHLHATKRPRAAVTCEENERRPNATATHTPDTIGLWRTNPRRMHLRTFNASHSDRQRLTILDWSGMTLYAAALLVLSYVRSRNKMFWGDEVMGWVVLHESSFSQLLRSWWAGLDSSGIFFYIFARPWLLLFHDREIALRLFSATGMATSCVIFWICARRFFSVGVVATVLPVVFLWNGSVIWQLANGRTYGLFMCAMALVCYAFAITDPDEVLSRRALVITFFAHLLLVGSHILGILYSGVFLLGLLGRDLYFRKPRLKIYLSVVLSWSLLLISFRNLQATSALGKPSFWTSRPNVHDLVLGFTLFDRDLRKTFGFVLIVFLAAYLAQRGLASKNSTPTRGRVTLYALVASFAGCVVVIYLVSQITTSIFVDRYLMPVMLGLGLLLGELISRMLGWWKLRSFERTLAFLASSLVIVTLYRGSFQTNTGYPYPDYTRDLSAALPHDIPVVLPNIGLFIEMVHYQNKTVRLLTPIDWPIVLDPHYTRGEVSGLHEMENWKAMGHYSNQILTTSQILANPAFAVVADDEHSLWFRKRVELNPEFVVTNGGDLDIGYLKAHLWFVRHI